MPTTPADVQDLTHDGQGAGFAKLRPSEGEEEITCGEFQPPDGAEVHILPLGRGEVVERHCGYQNHTEKRKNENTLVQPGQGRIEIFEHSDFWCHGECLRVFIRDFHSRAIHGKSNGENVTEITL